MEIVSDEQVTVHGSLALSNQVLPGTSRRV